MLPKKINIVKFGMEWEKWGIKNLEKKQDKPVSSFEGFESNGL